MGTFANLIFPGSSPGGERSILDRKQWESDLDLQQDDARQTSDCYQDERFCQSCARLKGFEALNTLHT